MVTKPTATDDQRVDEAGAESFPASDPPAGTLGGGDAIVAAAAPRVDCESEAPGAYPQRLGVRSHTLRADASPAAGGADSAPDPHDYFDAALASCKALTALWYARQHGLPLERVETHVERDAALERKGTYRLTVRLAFHGPLDDAQRRRLYEAVARCPVHKLMTTSTVEIETAPL